MRWPAAKTLGRRRCEYVRECLSAQCAHRTAKEQRAAGWYARVLEHPDGLTWAVYRGPMREGGR